MNPITEPVTEPMIHADQRLDLKTGDVAAKNIDGEVLVMNVANGMYYSLDGVSAVTWRLIAEGNSLRQVAGALAAAWSVDESETLTDVTDLAIQLVEEGLVTVSATPVSDELPSIPEGDVTGSYARPTLNSYSDMADLLALDPPMPGLAETSFIPPEEG